MTSQSKPSDQAGPELLCLDTLLVMSKGIVTLEMDSDVIWASTEGCNPAYKYICERHDISDIYSIPAFLAEQIAEENPNHNWRIIFYGKRSKKIYQRTGRQAWTISEE